MTGLTFRHYGQAGAAAVRDTAEQVYRGSYSKEQQEDPFSSDGRWMCRFDAYAAIPGFELVIACTSDEEPAGQAWGWPLSAGSRWWNGLDAEPEPGFTREDSTRTFALFGAVIIDPPRLPRVSREFLIIQSELYLGPQRQPGDYAKMQRGQPDAVVFNE